MVQRTAEADEDLMGIWSYIATDNPKAADSLLDEIEDKFILLSEQPCLGPARSDIALGLRYFPVGSYLIFYREIANGIEVVRVVHGARRLINLF